MHSPESFDDRTSERIPQPEVHELNPEQDIALIEEGFAAHTRLQEAQAKLDEIMVNFNGMSPDERMNAAVITTVANALAEVKKLQDQYAALSASTEELTARYGENPKPNIPSIEDLPRL